jgi:hypothetical protein
VILMSDLKVEGARRRLVLQHEGVQAAHSRAREGRVDQTLMRGMATAGPWFTSGLPLSQMARMPVWRAESQRGLP